MNYIFSSKSNYEKCCDYLSLKKIDYKTYNLINYSLISIFDDSLKKQIENEEKAFLKSDDISLENGYLVSKQYKEKTIVEVKNVKIGAEIPVIISGPCSIESEESLRQIAHECKRQFQHTYC